MLQKMQSAARVNACPSVRAIPDGREAMPLRSCSFLKRIRLFPPVGDA